LDSALYEWFLLNQEKVPISGDMIKEKAQIFLKQLYPDKTMSFSNGWLESFKNRYKIKSYTKHGESGSVDLNNIAEALPLLHQLLNQYEWKDIYNMDETGLFYRLPADRSLATKQLEGTKKSKERLTVAVCTNGDGSHKLPCWIIGKYQNPRCFKGINIKYLDIQYRWNSKAWMTGTMFVEYVRWFDQQMHGRKVLLLVDNCPAHVKEGYDLCNTKIHYLPPNTTSKIQPCDAGIIRNLKVYYRKLFHYQILQNVEANKIEPEKIDILQAIHFIISAWKNDVSAETIYHCFLHCGIRALTDDDPDVDNNLIEIPDEINDLTNQINELKYRNPMDVEELLNHPDEVEIAEIPTDDDIIEMARENMRENENNELNDDTIERSKITYNEAINMLNSLELFFLQQDEDCSKILENIEIQKKKVFSIKQKNTIQLSINKYFSTLNLDNSFNNNLDDFDELNNFNE